MTTEEITRFKITGDWNNIGKLKTWEFVITKFNSPGNGGGGVDIKILNEEGNKINQISFNPFAAGCEIASDLRNTIHWDGKDFQDNVVNEYANVWDVKSLRAKKEKLETIIEAFEILKTGGED